MNKRLLLAMIMLFYSLIAASQVTIEECVDKAKLNYPQIKEKHLIEESEKYDLANANLNWVPQFSITGKASYQSDVVEMPFEIPGYDFNLPHDQYSLVGEISQSIWDGGTTSSKKRMVKADAEVRRKQLEVSIYSIRQRVENIYLGILLIDKQIAQNNILLESLNRNRKEVQTRIDNGMAYKSDLSIVDVNILNCNQSLSELQSDRMTYVAMLSQLTGEDMSAVKFTEPSLNISFDTAKIDRPELALYDAQLEQNKVQRQDLQTYISPKFNLSLQGGVGRPGLNMLKNEFEPYYIAAVRMQWNFGALYSRQNDIKKNDVQKRNVELERETFVFNTMLDITNQLNAVHKAEDVLKQDEEIINLRESIRKSGEEQYANGVIKMTDLMEMIDDEHDARVAKSLHEIQLMMAIYELKNSIGQ